MSFKDSKVVIIGAGNVGATTAYSIINQGLCEEIVLVDVNKDKALAEALDMQNSVHFMNRNIRVSAGDYSACADADIVIITAAAPMPKESNDRLKMLAPSISIMRSIIGSIMSSGFNGVLVLVSNPVDVMTYFAWRLSGLPRERVIGSGTTLDTARLCGAISEMYDLDSKSVEAYVMGEHGDSEFVSWNSATVGGKRIDDVMNDNRSRTTLSKEELLKKTVQAGWEIFNRKGNTCYGIASSVTAIVKSVLYNENRILPVSVYLSGQYGISDVFISAPSIIGNTGIKEIVEIRLGEDELAAMRHSAQILKSYYPALA